jgi:hypothetical protein
MRGTTTRHLAAVALVVLSAAGMLAVAAFAGPAAAAGGAEIACAYRSHVWVMSAVGAEVRVPSWRRFHSSYTGTDWETILRTAIKAIRTGFAKRGLVARVTLVDGYSGGTSRQRPRAGTWVPKGTVVRIRIAVYD